MRDSDTVKSHVARFRMLRANLITAGQNVIELQSAVALLMTLPEEYHAFVSTQNQKISAAAAGGRHAPQITLSDVIGALLNEEATHRTSRSQQSSSARALFTSRGRGRRFQQPRLYKLGNYSSFSPKQQGQVNQSATGFSTNPSKSKDPCN